MDEYFKYLNKKIAEYLLTLNDSHRDEWYATQRIFAGVELSNFVEWLEVNE